MENEEILNASQEMLENISTEELVDLKFELDEMMDDINDAIAECDSILNSQFKKGENMNYQDINDEYKNLNKRIEDKRVYITRAS